MTIIAIPSYNDPKSLIKCVKKIKETSPESKIYVVEQTSKTDVDVDKYVHYPEPLGVGKARRIVTDLIIKDHPDEIIVHVDDNTTVGKFAIDKLEKAMKTYPEFAWIGALNAFKHWLVGAGNSVEKLENEIIFTHSIGANLAALNPSFAKKHGHFKDMLVREDFELCGNAWSNGWYVGMIDVNLGHTRNTKSRTIDHPFHPKSEEFLSANAMIASLYPDHFKLIKNRQIRRKFKFPEKTYRI